MTKVYKYYLTKNSVSLLSSYSLSKSDISKVAESVAPFPATLVTFGYLCNDKTRHQTLSSKQRLMILLGSNSTKEGPSSLMHRRWSNQSSNICFVCLFFQQAIVEKRCCIVAFMNGITKKILKILRSMRHYYFKTEFWKTDFQTGWYISLEFSIIGALKTFRASHSCKILSTLTTFLARRLENTCIIFCTRSSPKLARFFSGYVNISTNLAYLSNTGVDF